MRFLWGRRSASGGGIQVDARMRALLLAAFNTRYYRRVLDATGLRKAADILALASPAEALRRLPALKLSQWRFRREAFVNRSASRSEAPRLFLPLPPVEKAAVLAAGFKRGRGVRVFSELRRSSLIRYRPQVIAGPVGVLRLLAEANEDRGAPVPRVSHAVIAFGGVRHGFVSDEARDLFWRIFEVPVFGQFLGPDGELLAWECEAHDGLHVRTEAALFETELRPTGPELLVTCLTNFRHPVLRLATGLAGEVCHSRCACGETATRLVGLRRRVLNGTPPFDATPVHALAASASCAAD